jgi:hypothetical protein
MLMVVAGVIVGMIAVCMVVISMVVTSMFVTCMVMIVVILGGGALGDPKADCDGGCQLDPVSVHLFLPFFG